MNWLTVLLKKILNPTWDFIIPSLVIASLLTFSPFDLRQRLGIEQHYLAIQLYVSLLLLYSAAMFLYRATALAATRLIEKRHLKIKRDQNHRQIKTFLKDMPEREKKMLAYICGSNSGAVWVPYHNPEVQSLLRKRIIYMLNNQITFPNEREIPPYSDWRYEYCTVISVNPVAAEHLYLLGTSKQESV